MGSVVHLATRFFGSLSDRPPSSLDTEFALGALRPGERLLWQRLRVEDRRHSIGVARAVQAELGRQAPRPVLAAALLHDCGKLVCGYGTFRRTGTTIVAAVAGRRRVAGWSGKMGQYLRHPELGAELLADGDSDALTIAWTAEHLLPPEAWTVPRDLGEVLKRADDD